MKKITYFLTLAVFVIAAFSSCDKDDDKSGGDVPKEDGTVEPTLDPSLDPALIGSWLLIEYYGSYINGAGEKVETQGSAGNGDLDDYVKYVFRNNGSVICYEREQDPDPDKGIWTVKDGYLYTQWGENSDGDIEIEKYEYAIIGNTLVLEETLYNEYYKEIYKKVK